MALKSKKRVKETALLEARQRAAKRKLRASKYGHTVGTVDREGKRVKAVRLRDAGSRELTRA